MQSTFLALPGCTEENLSQDNWSPGHYLNLVLPEHDVWLQVCYILIVSQYSEVKGIICKVTFIKIHCNISTVQCNMSTLVSHDKCIAVYFTYCFHNGNATEVIEQYEPRMKNIDIWCLYCCVLEIQQGHLFFESLVCIHPLAPLCWKYE